MTDHFDFFQFAVYGGKAEADREFAAMFDTTSRRLKLRRARAQLHQQREQRIVDLERRLVDMATVFQALVAICAEKGVLVPEEVLARAQQLAARRQAPPDGTQG